jgi:SnoaL-like domain
LVSVPRDIERADGVAKTAVLHGKRRSTSVAAMSTAQEVAGRVIDSVNAHDIEALRGLYAPEARTRRPGWPQDGGPAELLASYEMDFACVPDINFGPISTFADGSDGPHVVTEMRITGTNTGPTILGEFGKALVGGDVEAVPPTGRSIDLPAIFVHEVSDDLVTAERQYWGLLEFLVQIGVVGG